MALVGGLMCANEPRGDLAARIWAQLKSDAEHRTGYLVARGADDLEALLHECEALRAELKRSRRMGLAWKDAAVWRHRTGHHKSRAWHYRRRFRDV